MIQRMGRILRRKKIQEMLVLSVFTHTILMSALDLKQIIMKITLILVNDNADFKEQLDGNEIDSDEFAAKVRESIFFHT